MAYQNILGAYQNLNELLGKKTNNPKSEEAQGKFLAALVTYVINHGMREQPIRNLMREAQTMKFPKEEKAMSPGADYRKTELSSEKIQRLLKVMLLNWHANAAKENASGERLSRRDRQTIYQNWLQSEQSGGKVVMKSLPLGEKATRTSQRKGADNSAASPC
jgi:hypothetical protein